MLLNCLSCLTIRKNKSWVQRVVWRLLRHPKNTWLMLTLAPRMLRHCAKPRWSKTSHVSTAYAGMPQVLVCVRAGMCDPGEVGAAFPWRSASTCTRDARVHAYTASDRCGGHGPNGTTAIASLSITSRRGAPLRIRSASSRCCATVGDWTTCRRCAWTATAVRGTAHILGTNPSRSPATHPSQSTLRRMGTCEFTTTGPHPSPGLNEVYI